MKTLNNQLGSLISIGLDLTLFWNISISQYDISLLGKYSKNTEKHLLRKGFIKCDILYADNDNFVEFKNDICRIALTKD
jgi:hypothetical protein